MKHIILLIILTSCVISCKESSYSSWEITYINGQKETIKMTSTGKVLDGCVRNDGDGNYICGVRKISKLNQ